MDYYILGLALATKHQIDNYDILSEHDKSLICDRVKLIHDLADDECQQFTCINKCEWVYQWCFLWMYSGKEFDEKMKELNHSPYADVYPAFNLAMVQSYSGM